MSRTFEIDRTVYGEEILFTNNSLALEPGVTVLVGCNGVGKSTLIESIKQSLTKEGIPHLSFDNLSDGGTKSVSSAVFHRDMGLAASLFCSSEGEQLFINVCQFAEKIGRFLKEHSSENEIWVLLDAVDSGLSIDNVIELKEFFGFVIEDAAKYSSADIYIVASANSYEMCADEKCIYAKTGKYVQFNSYEEYRKFVLKSRKEKDSRQKVGKKK